MNYGKLNPKNKLYKYKQRNNVYCLSALVIISSNFPYNTVPMKGLSPATKARITTVADVGKTVFQYGYIPLILYLGFKKGAEPGMPPLSVFSLLWA